MVCDDRLGSINAFTNLPIEHINTRIAESSGRATRKGSPTRVLENRANQLPQFSADELAIHCSLVAGVVANDGATFNVAGVEQGYQDILHNLAGLTTKGDLWPDGCTNPDANNPGSIAAYAGQAPNKKYVVATVDNSNPNVIDIYQATPPVDQLGRPDGFRYCGSPTLRTISSNRGSDRKVSSKKSVFKPTRPPSRSR